MPPKKIFATPEEAQQYALDNDIIYLETSAKTSSNVKNLFIEIAKKLPKNNINTEKEAFPVAPPSKDKKGCC